MKPAILITGGAGYIGSHIGYLAAQKGYEVIVLDAFRHQQMFNPMWARIIKGDYADRELLRSIFVNHKIQAVIHCAAFIEVKESVINPIAYYENNVSKTITLLEEMIAAQVKKIIFSSSCAVYGQPQFLPLTESHPINPMSPYGKTKAMVESILADAANAAGVEYVSLRYFNAAGALPEEFLGEQHQPESHLIPLLLRAALIKAPFSVFGTEYPTKDGTAIRDFVHVLDIAQAHLLALEHLQNGYPSDVFNLGTGNGFSIKEMIHAAQEVCASEIKIQYAQPRAGDPHTLVADPSKAKTILRWQPIYSDLPFILRSALAFIRQQEVRINQNNDAALVCPS